MFNKTVYFQNQTSQKQYTVKIVPAARGKVNVIGLFGKIGAAQQTFQATMKPVAVDEAKTIAKHLLDSKLAKGYSLTLKPVKKAAVKSAKVSAPRSKAALELKAAEKKADARMPKKSADARAPKGNAVVATLAGLVSDVHSALKIGQLVKAKVETCGRCKGRDEECVYCEGSGKQVVVSNGIDGADTILRPSNLKFKRAA